MLVQGVNAFLNLSVKVSSEVRNPSFKVSPQSAVLLLPSASGLGGGGFAIPCVIVSTTANDTIACTDPDGDSVTVNRPTKLKASVSSETFDGITVTYSYTNSQQRVCSATGHVTHTQKLLPKYVAGETIYVMQLEAGGYIDINVDARAWQAVPYIPIP